MSEEPSWELYGAFLAVLQEGSLSAASRALQVAQPTVRRHIEKLEQHLGVVLFTRAPNGLVPTEVAIATRPYAEAMAANARALVRAISGGADEASGTVRVACSEIVGTFVLPSMLVDFARRQPAIQIELALSDRNEDLLRREADIAVRMVRPTQQGLVARRVGSVELGLFATAEYLALRTMPSNFCDLLSDHVLIGVDRRHDVLDALASHGLETKPSDYRLRTDSDVAQLQAVRAGLGIGICQLPLARRAPLLQRVLPEFALALEIWIVMHEDLRGARRVRAVFDHLVGEFEGYVA